ncbi:MAG: class I SAM-dependent methyltransferase [Nanobdellota archaeon]
MGFYDAIASGYDELHGDEQKRKLDFIFSKVSIGIGEKVLDVGCGTGIAQKYIEDRFGADTFGVDPSEGLLAKNPCKCRKASAESLPFGDGDFDIIISLTALQNFSDLRQGLSEMRRMGRRFILTYLKSVKDAGNIEGVVREIFPDAVRYDQGKDVVFIVGYFHNI